MTNRLEWDLVDGVSEYHILKYDNPNFNEATWDNHIVATVNDNHYEIDENETNYYVVAYEKDDIIILSCPIVQKLKNDGLICDIRVNYNKSRPHPTVLRDYPYDEFIMDNTGKSTFDFHSNFYSHSTNFISNGKEILCRIEPYTGSCYVEYENENDFGTNDFVIEFGIATTQRTEWITLCTIGKIQFLIKTSTNEIGVYYNQTWFGYNRHNQSNYDGYHKVKIERSGGIFKFYQNDFLIYKMTDKKSDILDNKFYIGNKLRNDYQLSYCIIDDVFINGKKVVPTNIVGENWQYTNGMMARTSTNNEPNFVVRLKEFLDNDFTIIGEVYLQYFSNDSTNRITFIDLQNFGLQINLQQRKLFAYNADTVYNEYIFKPTIENKPTKIAYVRKNGIVYIYVDDIAICSKTVQNTIDVINCILNNMAIKSLQVYNHSSFFNEDNGTIVNHLNNDAIKFTNVILNNDTVELSWTDTNGKMVKVFRDGYEIGTSNENKFTVNTIFKNKKQVYHLETDSYKSQEHIVYTHKYNPLYNAIGMDLCNNDGYIWDFRSTNTYAQDNDKTKQKPLYKLKPFYENKKGFGILGGNSNDMFNNINGCYHIKPKDPITDFTFETTINPNMFYGREMVLLHIIGTELFKFYQVYMYLDSRNRLAVKVADERNGIPSAQLIIQGNDQLQRNTWYNIVLTRSGSVYTLYLNGKSLGNTTTNAKLGISSVFVGANCYYRETSNNIYDFISLTNNVVYNGNYTVSKTLPQLTDNHIFYIDFENGWEDKSNNKHKNLVFNNSYIGYADYSDNWFTSIDRNEFGNFYYHWDQINFDSMSVMIEFDYIPIIDSNFFRNTLSQLLTSSGGGALRYFTQQYPYPTYTEHKKITNCRLKGVILIENRGKTLNFATLYINGVMVKSVHHKSSNINKLLHNVNFFDNGMAGYVSNFRIYTNITPLFEHDYEKGIGFTYNSKVIDYRCSINKNSITIDDSNPNNVYDVYDHIGNKILDGVKKGTHNCTIENEEYFIIERNSELIFNKWIDLDDEHWDNVVFYHKFGNENDEKFNHPMQSRYPLIFENGVLLARHVVIHTRAFDIGTSDFTIEIELKTSFKTEKQEAIVTINSMYESPSYGNFALNYNGGLYMADYSGSVNATWNIASNVGANYLSNMEWRSVVIMRKNGVLTYSVDGVEMWRTNSTHNIRPHYARNIVLGYNHEMVMFRKFRITKSARF